MPLQPGLIGELEITVQASDTARASGGETFPPVLSTPRMIGYLERTAHQSILPYLPDGQTSVGAYVNVHHLAATPVGMKVRFHSELLAVHGRKLTFKVEAWDAVEKIADGEHERYIIDLARFDQRITEKQKLIG